MRDIYIYLGIHRRIIDRSPTEGVRTKRVSPVALSAIAQSTGGFDPFPLPVRSQKGLISSQSPAVSFFPPGRFGG